ncbi:DUF4345 domain-containing protein [Methylobacterium sp. J-090]|uniref:DUF4345 domain-containing protein n=1 Tax=Methylobacterium sp. J-090 TaxID=2836666 RepID=UPI001FBBB509|nr:DUF4345 domain-containing protein [Methylobacterium sp. J-090]MCJ2080119.1 DUF4345 domain-containing protein [Methylobacterium sp. J-090]
MRERQALQRVVAAVALVPVTSGLYGVVFGLGSAGGLVDVSADSHYRYLSGLHMGIGILFWTCVPGIEAKTGLFRFLTLVVALGGLARLLGLALTGLPSLTMMAALVVELAVTPLLCLWQARVAGRSLDATAPAGPPTA